MNKIDWKRKLTSCKFWAAIIGFVTALCVALGVKDVTQEQIIGEGLTDAANSGKDKDEK